MYDIRELTQLHEAELLRVRKWEYEHLVLPFRKVRRVRETVTIELHPTGWKCNLGFDGQQICRSVSTGSGGGLLTVDGYWDFHGGRDDYPKHPTVWKVTRCRNRQYWEEYWCDAHFPQDLREQVEAIV